MRPSLKEQYIEATDTVSDATLRVRHLETQLALARKALDVAEEQKGQLGQTLLTRLMRDKEQANTQEADKGITFVITGAEFVDNGRTEFVDDGRTEAEEEEGGEGKDGDERPPIPQASACATRDKEDRASSESGNTSPPVSSGPDSLESRARAAGECPGFPKPHDMPMSEWMHCRLPTEATEAAGAAGHGPAGLTLTGATEAEREYEEWLAAKGRSTRLAAETTSETLR